MKGLALRPLVALLIVSAILLSYAALPGKGAAIPAMAQETPPALGSDKGTERLEVEIRGPAAQVMLALGDIPGILDVTRPADVTRTAVENVVSYNVTASRGMDVREQIADMVVQHGWGLLKLQPMRPKANLPYLFAVYAITWVIFFAYLYYLSQRQRNLRREVEELRQALAEREDQGGGSVRGDAG